MTEREVLFFIIGQIGIEDKPELDRVEFDMISRKTLNTIRGMIREVVFPAQVVVAGPITIQELKGNTPYIPKT